MKLLQIIASADLGGAEVHVEHIVRQVPAEHAVLALADGVMVKRWQAAGARIMMAPVRAKLPLAALPAVRELISRFQPDVIHTHTPKANLLGALARPPGPRVMTIHGSHRQFASARLLPAAVYVHADRWAARRAAAVIAVCVEDQDELLARGFPADRLRVVPNGVPDPGVFAGRLRALEAAREVVWIGRFSPEKRPELMMEVAWRLGPETRVLMVGHGERRPLGEQPANTRFAPPLPDLRLLWSTAAVLVNTSLSEGASLVILEALAAGVPVVATAVGGNPELVGEGGEVVAEGPELKDRLVAAVHRVLKAKNYPVLCRRARERYERLFRVERMADDLRRLYEEVAGRGGKIDD